MPLEELTTAGEEAAMQRSPLVDAPLTLPIKFETDLDESEVSIEDFKLESPRSALENKSPVNPTWQSWAPSPVLSGSRFSGWSMAGPIIKWSSQKLPQPATNGMQPHRHSVITFRPLKEDGIGEGLGPQILPISPTQPRGNLCSLDEILDELGIHERSLKFEDSVFPCPECHAPSDRPVSCRSGRPLVEGYNTIVDLSQHLKTHPNAKIFQCVHCPFKANRKTPYLVHCWEKHLKVKPYKCVAGCGESFFCVKKRLEHIKNCSYCGDEKDAANLKCPHCPALFASERTLFEHVKTHPEPMRCRQCGKVSKNMGNFCAHWRMHTGVKPWGCLCGRTFSIKNSLKQHVIGCQNIDQSRIKRRKKSGKRKSDVAGLTVRPSKRPKTEPALFPLKRGGFSWPLEVDSNILNPVTRTMKTSTNSLPTRKPLPNTINFMSFPAWSAQEPKIGGNLLPPPVDTSTKPNSLAQNEQMIRAMKPDEDARSPIPTFTTPPAADPEPVGDMQSRTNLPPTSPLGGPIPSAPLKISMGLTPFLPLNNQPSFEKDAKQPSATPTSDDWTKENQNLRGPTPLIRIRPTDAYRRTSLMEMAARNKHVQVQRIMSSNICSPLQYMAKMRNQRLLQKLPPLPDFPGGSLTGSFNPDPMANPMKNDPVLLGDPTQSMFGTQNQRLVPPGY